MRINTSRLLITLVIITMLGMTACIASGKANYDPVTMDLPVVDKAYPPFIRELFIPSGDVAMTGLLLGANGPGPHPTVVLLHGYPGNEKNLDLAQSMRRAGFNVLFFHYRGAWGSQGDYSLAQLAEDVAAALTYLRTHANDSRVDVRKLTVIGHSMGGFAALRSGSQDPQLVCVAGLAAANIGEYSQRDAASLAGFKAYTDNLFMLHNFDGAQALQELKAHARDFDVSRYGPDLRGKSVLLVTGREDSVVPASVQARIAEAYQRVDGLELTTEIIPGDHAFSVSRIQLQHLIIDWLNRDCR